MVCENFIDKFDGTNNHNFFGYRCVLCGNIEDPVISENRKKRLIPTRQPINESAILGQRK